MKKTLLLVDGSSYLYRAYHAMPDLRNSQNEPTGALYGVINMMHKLSQEYKADYAACVFDAKGKTFRDDLYVEYKAQRPSMPDDLREQIEPIHMAVKALGWPVLVVPGVEADDVIGTLSVLATEKGLNTIISTGDKDIAQLVNDSVTLVNTMNNDFLDIAGVINKFGVTPERMIDYLMLIGDTSDNIPGVTKVGPKTAVKWLDQYQSLENLVSHAEEIKGVVGNNLREALPQFDLTRQLVTIKTDCDLSEHMADFEALAMGEPNKEILKEVYQRYGFKTWLRQVSENAGDEAVNTEISPVQSSLEGFDIPDAPTETNYIMVNTPDLLAQCLAAIDAADLVAFDTETDSLDAMQANLVGMSFSHQAGSAWYIPLGHTGMQNVEQLDKSQTLLSVKTWLEDDSKAKILQNAKYDTHVLANEGIRLQGVKHDTMLMAYVLKSHEGVGMQALARKYLGREGVSYESLCGKGAGQISFAQVDIEKATFYACEDADFTYQLYTTFAAQLENEKALLPIYDLELKVSSVLATIERNGVRLDINELIHQSDDLGKQLISLEQKAYELAGQPFNLNSPKQLSEIFFEKMKLPVLGKTPKGAPSTDEDVLTKLARDYPLPQVLLEYRGLAKLKSTYTDKLPKMVDSTTGRVHTDYAQAAVITGRLASSNPNLQNIPVRTEQGRKVRKAFIASEGNIIMSADYSQIELRVMAHVSGDENLQKAFAQNLDIHKATAAEVFGVALDAVTSEQRRAAKAINFGLIYGMGVFGLSNNLGITRDAAQRYIDMYFARYPGVAQYMESIKQNAAIKGYVETVFGRRLWLPEIKSKQANRRAGAERVAINAPMQGTAADLIKKAMVAVQAWLESEKMQSKLIMQVHDELVLDVPLSEQDKVAECLPALMCDVAVLSVPLIAELGRGANWDEAH